MSLELYLIKSKQSGFCNNLYKAERNGVYNRVSDLLINDVGGSLFLIYAN